MLNYAGEAPAEEKKSIRGQTEREPVPGTAVTTKEKAKIKKVNEGAIRCITPKTRSTGQTRPTLRLFCKPGGAAERAGARVPLEEARQSDGQREQMVQAQSERAEGGGFRDGVFRQGFTEAVAVARGAHAQRQKRTHGVSFCRIETLITAQQEDISREVRRIDEM